uniref:Uncharacterized protein n=1 Tax=Knipowitschia caucasica TaxID=637954 RepID=A0AAV2JW94_KNICA
MLKPVPDNLCPQEQPSPLPGNKIETEEEDEEPFVFVVRGPVPGWPSQSKSRNREVPGEQPGSQLVDIQIPFVSLLR